MRDNLLDHRLHLVYLDGINHVVLAFVVVLLGCLFKAAPRFLDTIIKNIGETQQYWWRNITQCQFVHYLAQVNLCAVLAGGNVNIALVVDTKIRSAPTVDVVQLL